VAKDSIDVSTITIIIIIICNDRICYSTWAGIETINIKGLQLDDCRSMALAVTSDSF
jgi:hypothetical protein